MNELMVSVIVPVHNTPKLYLKKCMDSIFGQTYKVIETILIDDASNSDTAGICDIYAENDNVKVIHNISRGGKSCS